MSEQFQQLAQALVDTGRVLYQRGLVPATSGNFSARLDDGSLAITVSGAHKGLLTPDDILHADAEGRSLDARRPSAETLLHVQIYRRFPEARAVLQPHSASATVLSQLLMAAASGDETRLHLQDYELLKAFPGIDSHEARVAVPVFANSQDIAALAQQVDDHMHAHGPLFGYLIAGHGFYTWGRDVAEALRHVEAFEFLFDCELKARSLCP